MMATDEAVPQGLFSRLPNLKCVQFLGHGASDILGHSELPRAVTVCRLKDPGIVQWTTEYVLAQILRHRWHGALYETQQRREEWKWHTVPEAHETLVGVLGLGVIGEHLAGKLVDFGFNVSGWARGPHDIKNVKCCHGLEALKAMLSKQDYVVCVLPGTRATRGLLNKEMFDAMKPGAHFINVGRGSVVDEKSLLNALDLGGLGSATLDAIAREPLPAGDPLWRHPKVTLTPHIAGGKVTISRKSARSGEMDAVATTAENYRHLLGGDCLVNIVDRERGY